MRLSEASVAIRPRSPWEAVDLGILLSQRHRQLLMSSWLIVSLPLLALLSALLWQHPFWALLIFWWLKPLLDRLPLYILSQALFGQTPTLRQALKAYPALLKPQLLASLTWRRFSPIRSFTLPIQQLEHLTGKARQQRINDLSHGRNHTAALSLTLIGVHIELALYSGLSVLALLMLPHELELNWNWQMLISPNSSQWLWIEHLSNLGYALVLVLWEPIYVACGFSLYLNQRTKLEAWDIELVFRRLSLRLRSAAPLLLAAILMLGNLPGPAHASESVAPEAPRLLEQKLSSQHAQEEIKSLLDAPPFRHSETVSRWRLGDESSSQEESTRPEWLKNLFKNNDWQSSLSGIAVFFEVLLWAIVLGLLTLLLWRYRAWLYAFGHTLKRTPAQEHEIPEQMFGLDIKSQNLPDDVASYAYELWPADCRAAMSLLYRALLNYLLHEKQLPLKASHTEAEVLAMLETQHDAALFTYSQQLTEHWQALAYGACMPPIAQREELCQAWRDIAGQGRL